MKKVYIVLLIILGVIALVVIGLTVVITTPKDLGVKYTKADLDSVNNKLGINADRVVDIPKSNAAITNVFTEEVLRPARRMPPMIEPAPCADMIIAYVEALP